MQTGFPSAVCQGEEEQQAVAAAAADGSATPLSVSE